MSISMSFTAISCLVTQCQIGEGASGSKERERKKFTCTNISVWPARPANKKLENNTERMCDITLYSRCHYATGPLHSKNSFFLKSDEAEFCI